MKSKQWSERTCLQNISVVGDFYPECVKDSTIRRYSPTQIGGGEFWTDILKSVQQAHKEVLRAIRECKVKPHEMCWCQIRRLTDAQCLEVSVPATLRHGWWEVDGLFENSLAVLTKFNIYPPYNPAGLLMRNKVICLNKTWTWGS